MKKRFFAVAMAATMAISSVMTASAADVYTQDYTLTSNSAYTEVDNPLQGKNLDKIVIEYTCTTAEGAAANGWDGLFAFYNPETKGRISFQTRPYLCWNDMDGGAGFIDINHPDNKEGTFALKAGEQQTVVWTITADSVVCTVDGEKIEIGTDGKSADTVTYTDLLTAFNTYPKLTIGVGQEVSSFWWTELASGKITISDGKTENNIENPTTNPEVENPSGSTTDPEVTTNPSGSTTDPEVTTNPSGSTTDPEVTTKPEVIVATDKDMKVDGEVKDENGKVVTKTEIHYSKVAEERASVVKNHKENVTILKDKKFGMLEIDLYNKDNDTKIEKLGDVIKVTISKDVLPTEVKNFKKVTVYRAEDDGKLTKLKTTVNADKSVTFETDHFSTYVFVEEVENNDNNDNNDNTPSDSTTKPEVTTNPSGSTTNPEVTTNPSAGKPSGNPTNPEGTNATDKEMKINGEVKDEAGNVINNPQLWYNKVTEARATEVKKANEALFNTFKKFGMLEIDLWSDGVQYHQLNGMIEVTVAKDVLPEEVKDSKNIVVYRAADDGKLTKLDTTVNADGSVTFKTDHFSTYVFAELEGKGTTGKPSKTGDTAPIAGLIFVAGCALAVAVVSKKKLV